MNTLKMTAYIANGKLYNSHYESDEEIPEEELCHNNWWHLHGELESIVGYDKALTTNCKSAGYSIPGLFENYGDGPSTVPMIHLDAVIPVEVEGIDRPCLGYFWTVMHRTEELDGKPVMKWVQRGLVVLADNEGDNDYAKKKFNEKSFTL